MAEKKIGAKTFRFAFVHKDRNASLWFYSMDIYSHFQFSACDISHRIANLQTANDPTYFLGYRNIRVEFLEKLD
jgi:hypothetical protein